MRYLGGKSKIRKQVSQFLESVRKPDQVYFEPFAGGGWILQEMSGRRIASDGNVADRPKRIEKVFMHKTQVKDELLKT